MFNMANLRSWVVALGLVLTASGLVGHFIADAACGSAETSVASPCDSVRPGNSTGASALTASPLHTGVVVPAVINLALPAMLCLALVGVGFNKVARFVSPPVQPPKTISIA